MAWSSITVSCGQGNGDIVRKNVHRRVKDLVKDEEWNPPLKERSDEDLKELVKGLGEERKVLREKLHKALSKYWSIKSNIRETERIISKVLVTKGARKGKSCPARARFKRIHGYWTESVCEARRGRQNFRDDDELYRKFCSTCILLPKTIRKRLAFKRLFETKGESK